MKKILLSLLVTYLPLCALWFAPVPSGLNGRNDAVPPNRPVSLQPITHKPVVFWNQATQGGLKASAGNSAATNEQGVYVVKRPAALPEKNNPLNH